MSEGAIVRDYRPSDFDAVKAIHEASQIDYQMPDLESSLWLVKKVIEVEGVIRAAAGMYIQTETYLWLDKTNWADAEQKYAAIKVLDKKVMSETWMKGVDCAVLWIPPGMQSFGKRLEELGFTRDRDGWVSYSKPTKTETK